MEHLKTLLQSPRREHVFEEKTILLLKDWSICKRKPKLLIKGLLDRKVELRDSYSHGQGDKRPYNKTNRGPPPAAKPEETKFERKEKSELEKQMEVQATEYLKKEKTDTVRGDIKLALNKLTPDNYTIVFDDIAKLRAKTEDAPKILVEIIFRKAWKEQKYIRVYARLCNDLVNREWEASGKAGPRKLTHSQFRTSIIHCCEDTFRNRNVITKAQGSPEEIELAAAERRQKLFGSTPLATDT